ncbi:MAG: hypothetical protein NTV80_12935 [Verrucomicrobia bacterium]|nr:hypothetical protein [Verrucomicrobiota bacterium]
MKFCLLLIAIHLAQTIYSMATERIWTDIQGRSIKAEFISLDDATSQVKLRLSNGSEPLIPMKTLSPADCAWIAEQQRAKMAFFMEQKANVGKVVSLKSEGEESVGFHVYYPTTFDPASPPAMIIMFSPGGNGKGILGTVKAACESLGWIGVGCDNFKNGVSESTLDPKWHEVLPAIEKTVLHNPDLIYLGGMSGGALRSYDYSETTMRPWKGVLAMGGWLAGKTELGCPPQMAIACVNGDKDKGAIEYGKRELPILQKAQATVKSFEFSGGHVVGTPDIILEAMQWLQKTTVPGKRMPSGERHHAPLDRDNGTLPK